MRGSSCGEPAGVSTPTISTRRAARCASLPTGAPEPPRAEAVFAPALPPALPPFGAFFVPLMISALDHFAGCLGNADLATTLQHPKANLGRLLGLRVDQFQVRQMDRRLTLLNPTLLSLARLRVVRGHVDAGYQRAVGVGEHPHDLAPPALALAGDHQDGV